MLESVHDTPSLRRVSRRIVRRLVLKGQILADSLHLQNGFQRLKADIYDALALRAIKRFGPKIEAYAKRRGIHYKGS